MRRDTKSIQLHQPDRLLAEGNRYSPFIAADACNAYHGCESVFASRTRLLFCVFSCWPPLDS